MKTLLKSLIVWLLLLAVPFQGFASATMLLCTPIPAVAAEHVHGAAPAAPHDHQAMLAASPGAHHDSGAPSDDHVSGKCGSCPDCFIGASMAPSALTALPVPGPHFEAIPFASGFPPAVHLALPERPPKSFA